MGIGRIGRLVIFLALVALASERPAQAQWGFGGGGFGWGGWGGWGYPLPSYAYGVAPRASVRDGIRVDTSNSYERSARTSIYRDRFDAATMRRLEDQVARRRFPASQQQNNSATANPARVATPAPASNANTGANSNTTLASHQQQAPSLSSFFDDGGKLAWPGESPVDGDLAAKRQAADEAIAAVFKHRNDPDGASVTLAANARKKLLAYGQPALQVMRTTRPHAIADNFHSYLLELYDALAAATAPQRSA